VENNQRAPLVAIFVLLSLVFICLTSLCISRDPVGAKGLGKPLFSETLQSYRIENGELMLNSSPPSVKVLEIGHIFIYLKVRGFVSF
jgi:hypothetical protein